MTDEATLENGAARVGAGTWLMGRAQPAACLGSASLARLKGFVVPDRAAVSVVTTTGDAWCADAARPFLTRIPALPDEPLNVVSPKLLVAPADVRAGAANLKLVPFSLRASAVTTRFLKGWVVLATKSRVTRVAVEDGATLTVRPEALVAWVGKAPTGFCPRLTLLDLLLPRGPRNLAFTFHGPAVVWFEGGEVPVFRRRMPHGV